MTVMLENNVPTTQALAGRVRTYLRRIAVHGEPINY